MGVREIKGCLSYHVSRQLELRGAVSDGPTKPIYNRSSRILPYTLWTGTKGTTYSPSMYPSSSLLPPPLTPSLPASFFHSFILFNRNLLLRNSVYEMSRVVTPKSKKNPEDHPHHQCVVSIRPSMCPTTTSLPETSILLITLFQKGGNGSADH